MRCRAANFFTSTCAARTASSSSSSNAKRGTFLKTSGSQAIGHPVLNLNSIALSMLHDIWKVYRESYLAANSRTADVLAAQQSENEPKAFADLNHAAAHELQLATRDSRVRRVAAIRFHAQRPPGIEFAQ